MYFRTRANLFTLGLDGVGSVVPDRSDAVGRAVRVGDVVMVPWNRHGAVCDRPVTMYGVVAGQWSGVDRKGSGIAVAPVLVADMGLSGVVDHHRVLSVDWSSVSGQDVDGLCVRVQSGNVLVAGLPQSGECAGVVGAADCVVEDIDSGVNRVVFPDGWGDGRAGFLPRGHHAPGDGRGHPGYDFRARGGDFRDVFGTPVMIGDVVCRHRYRDWADLCRVVKVQGNVNMVHLVGGKRRHSDVHNIVVVTPAPGCLQV